MIAVLLIILVKNVFRRRRRTRIVMVIDISFGLLLFEMRYQ
jgi:hypothetical protein